MSPRRSQPIAGRRRRRRQLTSLLRISIILRERRSNPSVTVRRAATAGLPAGQHEKINSASAGDADKPN